MAATSAGDGYWLMAADGGVFAFGHAPFLGSAGSTRNPAPFVDMVATARGFPFPPGGTGNDLSLYDCQRIPAAHRAVAIVQVSGGAINNDPNPCYRAEAAWAGSDMAAYIFMDGLPAPAPKESLTGPAGACAAGNVTCESYNFGYFWARHWVLYSRSLGVNPTLWWLDVETTGYWNPGGAYASSNANVVSGAVAGLRASGVLAGIYSTAYQWNKITGSLINFPRIPLWVPGAGNISGPGNTAQTFCHTPQPLYEPFAQGSAVVVQYGYHWAGSPAGSYTGPPSVLDQDYACP
jgi:hypothetical protein